MNRPASNVFVLVCMMLAFKGHLCEPFFEEGHEIMPMSLEDREATMSDEVGNCIKPEDSCTDRRQECCPSSTCRCNLWGFNCICQPNETISMQFEEPVMRAPTKKSASSIYVHRRSCVRRGGACDHHPNDCCFSSSCRCNLWGSNCRCQRMGLFQKWG